MIKAIIFDFGGVFSTDDDIPKFWQNNATKFNVDVEEAKKIGLPIWLDARIGKIDSNLFWEQLSPLVNMTPEEFKKFFIEKTGWREELYQFVKNELRGKYKLAILSNQIESWLEPILEEKKFREIFDVIVTSYEAGYAKPDAEIYKIVLDKLALRPEECLYIEDRVKNLEPAKILGMETILFKNYDQFIKDLNNLLEE